MYIHTYIYVRNMYYCTYDIVEAHCNVVTTSKLVLMGIYVRTCILYTIEEGLRGRNISQSVAILLHTYVHMYVSAHQGQFASIAVRTYILKDTMGSTEVNPFLCT